MLGVLREFAEHSLHVRLDAKTIKQPLRRFAEDKRKVIGDEIIRLLAAEPGLSWKCTTRTGWPTRSWC